MIVRLDGHLEIQARELRQMPVRVRVLSAEDGADLEDALHVRRDAHLLRQLRALRQESRSSEIVDLEHRCAALSPAPLELARLDLDEAAREQRLAE